MVSKTGPLQQFLCVYERYRWICSDSVIPTGAEPLDFARGRLREAKWSLSRAKSRDAAVGTTATWAQHGLRAGEEALSEGQQTPRIDHQDGVDLALAVAALLHHRHDVAEDMAVAMAAERRETRAVADVVADHDAIEMAVGDQGPDQPKARGIVGHVDVRQAVVARLQAEQVELDGDA